MTKTPIRVVVTGFGALGPKSLNFNDLWSHVSKGRSALSSFPSELQPAPGLPCHVIGQVPPIPEEKIPPPFKPKRLSKLSRMFLLAAQEAVQHANLLETPPCSRLPIYAVVGISVTDLEMVAANDSKVRDGGASRALLHSSSQAGAQATTAATVLYLQSNLPKHQAGHIGRTVSCACTSGLDAIGEAWRLIRDGEADLVITGGVDAPLVPYPLAAYNQGGLMSHHQHPDTASRPFDCFADTGIVSEGAACLVMESLEHAHWRRAHPYLEICSYGSRFDVPDVPGSGYLPSMESALSQVHDLHQPLGHISAWAPGLPLLDGAEANAISQLLERSNRSKDSVPVYSIKGTTGNPFAAAGAMQVAVECAGAHHDLLPPTANLEFPLTEKIDLIMNSPRRGFEDLGLINSHGVGGGNSSLVVRKIE